jgi:hypothetical protein
MENLFNNIERMLRPYREIQKITEPIRQVQKNLEESLKPVKEFQKAFEQINKIYASIPKFENPILEHLDTFKEIGERLKKYAENTPKFLLIIAQHGWFIELDSELRLPSQIVKKIQDGDVESANRILTIYYASNVDRIFNELCERHPQRKEILSQILIAYKEKKHSLLIPSVLTQVDGICFDFTKRKFFIKEKNNNYLPEISSELEKSADSFLAIYLSPLQNQTPIMVRETDINKFPCHLNRHEILHGVSTSYGIEINSLKVISLLKYISDLLIEIDEKH